MIKSRLERGGFFIPKKTMYTDYTDGTDFLKILSVKIGEIRLIRVP